ncbi:MAG: hypothetical protein ACRD43_11550 [Pyrinomonadaceae bacterium]
MKRSKTITGLFALITLTAIYGLVTSVAAQDRVRCVDKTIRVENVYYVDSGKVVNAVHPGPNGGNGYQLNILGKNVDKLELIKERYMTSVGVIPNYTNASSAKWGLTFAANRQQGLHEVRMKNKCTGETDTYKLDSPVELLSQ